MVRYSNSTLLLRSKLAERQALNSRYSMRAFARDLGLAPSRMSEILKGKQRLSAQKAKEISQALGLSDSEKEFFVLQVAAEASRSRKARREAQEALSRLVANQPVSSLTEDQFHVISDWYHFAILELLQTKECQSTTRWIARRLGITEIQAQEALERLIRLGLVKQERGRLLSTEVHLQTTYEVPSESIRRFSRQILELAQNAIVHQSVMERDIGTLTVAIHPDEIPSIKEFLRKKRRALNRKLYEKSRVQKPTEVYVLATQFFRLTQLANGERI